MFNFWQFFTGFGLFETPDYFYDTHVPQSYKYVVELEKEVIIDYPTFPRLIINTHKHTLTIGTEKPVTYLIGTFSKHLIHVSENSSHIRITLSGGATLTLLSQIRLLTIKKNGETLLYRKLAVLEEK